MSALAASRCAQHSSGIAPGQPGMPMPCTPPDDTTRSTDTGRATLERYGPEALAQGFTALPNLVFAYYTRLGLSEGELVFVLQLWTYWWGAGLPFPALGTIASRMGKTTRQVQHYLERLRGLGLVEVTVRHDERGGQISNGYDIRPLLHALVAAAREASAPDERHRPGERGRGVAHGSRAPVQPASPEERPVQADPRSISISTTPDPLERTGGPAPAEPDASGPAHAAYPPALAAVLDDVGQRLGDCAPRSTRTRALRLQGDYRMEDGPFIRLIELAARRIAEAAPDIARRSPDGHPNAMPYLFATLEQLLRGAREDAPATPCPLRRQAPGEDAAPPEEGQVGGSSGREPAGHPLWLAVRAGLQATLAGAVFRARVAPLRAEVDPEGDLVLVAPYASS